MASVTEPWNRSSTLCGQKFSQTLVDKIKSIDFLFAPEEESEGNRIGGEGFDWISRSMGTIAMNDPDIYLIQIAKLSV